MGRNRTVERKVRGKSAAGALVLRRRRRDAGVMPRATGSRPSPIRAAYDHFRLERQGELVSDNTLTFYDGMVYPFLDWLGGEGVQRFEHLDIDLARTYRAHLASM